MTIGRFEDLECWKEARVLVNTVYEAINLSEKFRGDYLFAEKRKTL
jgi:CRISPR/Cas system-associated endonuclease/helicase Cas3